jgi:dipeptidyl aminopeptidase/acylaminoacyl peptidase
VLRLEGKDVQFVRYANESHNFSRRESIEDALERMHRFFDQRLRAR